jgi:hypothetical protein
MAEIRFETDKQLLKTREPKTCNWFDMGGTAQMIVRTDSGFDTPARIRRYDQPLVDSPVPDCEDGESNAAVGGSMYSVVTQKPAESDSRPIAKAATPSRHAMSEDADIDAEERWVMQDLSFHGKVSQLY